jgi:hypothetical protein
MQFEEQQCGQSSEVNENGVYANVEEQVDCKSLQ